MPELEFAGRRVHFTDAGSGEPVLLLHAAFSSSAQWRSLSETLLARGRLRVLAVDLQGYGGSAPWDAGKPLHLEDEFGPLRAVLTRAGDGPVHLVGHSYGGMLALRLALADRAPALLSLTLIEPPALWLLREAGAQGLYVEARALANGFVRDFDAGDVAGAVAPCMDFWGGVGAWEALPQTVKNYVIGSAGKSRQEWAIALGDADAGAPLADLGRLRTPTLLVRGEKTRALARCIVDLLQAAIPGAVTVEVPGAGHMSPISHPQTVNAVIADHLANPASRLRASGK